MPLIPKFWLLDHNLMVTIFFLTDYKILINMKVALVISIEKCGLLVPKLIWLTSGHDQDLRQSQAKLSM